MLQNNSDNAGIENYFANPRNPGGLTSNVAVLAKGSEKSVDSVKKWMQSSDSLNLFKDRRKHYSKEAVSGVSGTFDLWQADLLDVSNWSAENNGIHFLLVCIDVFSKYIFVVPVENKGGQTMRIAFERIFDEAARKQYAVEIRKRLVPIKIQTDKGLEFRNTAVQKLFQQKDIEWYATQGEAKASVVERVNRTLRMRIARYQHINNTLRYVDALSDIVHGYNATPHSTTKITPDAVQTSDTHDKEVWGELNGAIYRDLKLLCCDGAHDQRLNAKVYGKGKFKVGDYVRISRVKHVFEKGYTPNWSEEVMRISEVKVYPADASTDVMPVYKIVDLQNDPVEGRFYEEELQKVDYDPTREYKIEKVLKTRTVGGKKQYFVKWLGWPDKFNSWVSGIKDIGSGTTTKSNIPTSTAVER